jgi:hypothetical protein
MPTMLDVAVNDVVERFFMLHRLMSLCKIRVPLTPIVPFTSSVDVGFERLTPNIPFDEYSNVFPDVLLKLMTELTLNDSRGFVIPGPIPTLLP